MKRGIVTVEDTKQHRQLLREAAECASGTGAELILVALILESNLEQDVETMNLIGEVESVHYGESTVVQGAVSEVKGIAQEVLSDIEVPLSTIAAVVDEEEQAKDFIRLGAEHDCDHAFIVGRARSPTGKALFGDDAQRVLLNFDGYVTVRME